MPPKTPPLFTILDTWRPDPLAWQSRVDYRLLTSMQEVRDILREYWTPENPLAADFETTGLNVYARGFHAVGLSISWAPGKAGYIPLRHLVHPELNLPEGEVLDLLTQGDARQLRSLWYNYRYDGQVLESTGREFQCWDDVRLAVWLTDSNQKVTGLKQTALRLLGIKMESFEETAGDVPHFGHLDPTVAYRYPCADADIENRIWRLPAVQEAREAQRYIYELERLVMPIVWRGQRHGIYLDPEALDRVKAETRAKIAEATATVYALVDEAWEARVQQISQQVEDEAQRASMLQLLGDRPGAFNLASTPQIARILTDVCAVPIEERTDSGQVATGADVLKRYEDDYPVCKAITQLREFSALSTNYVDKLIDWVATEGPLARFNFHTMGAPTGRMSSSGKKDEGVVPLNVQSVPEPDKHPDKPNLRVAFCANPPGTPEPDREWVIVSIDYSQIEMRVAGNLAREPAWIAAFNEGVDIHLANARLAYGRPELQRGTEEGEEARGKGKTMGFAVLFQAGVDTVAKHGDISSEAAEGLIETFYRNVPALKTWIAGCKARAKSEGCIKTAFGRVRWLRDYYVRGASRALEEQGNREAVNTPVQGTAADILKLAIVKVDRLIRERGWERDVLQVKWIHDEIVFRVRRSTQAEVIPALVEAMQFKIGGRPGHPAWPIPLVAEAGVGWDWGKLRKWDGVPL